MTSRSKPATSIMKKTKREGFIHKIRYIFSNDNNDSDMEMDKMEKIDNKNISYNQRKPKKLQISYYHPLYIAKLKQEIFGIFKEKVYIS